MENFEVHNPTHLHFGKNVTDTLGETAKCYGNKVLLIYGKGSIQKNGIYEIVINQLESSKLEILEYNGIKPNPVLEDVIRAAEEVILNRIDVIVAVGGGSVIDTAKMVSLSAANKLDPWSIMKYKSKPTKKIPLINVLTLAATGTEMNGAAVIQNHKTEEKIGYVSKLNFPEHSFLDPQFTYSVPANYTAYGVVDLIAHTLEAYFSGGYCSLSDRFAESVIKEAMEYGPKALEKPDNYEYRANIMWAATNALNGLIGYGKTRGDWGVHDLGHQISLLFDTPHGATLSIAYPAWLKLQSKKIPERISQLGMQLFNDSSVDKTIANLEKFFRKIGSPVHLKELGISEKQKNLLTEFMLKNQVDGMVHKLNDEERKELVDLMY